jgi:hypothetical protein
MKKAIVLVAVLAAASSAFAAIGDSWILPLERQGDGWTVYAGAGYGGADAYGANTMDGVRRALWKTNGTTMPTTTELYTIEFFVPTSGATNWQPIESQLNGVDGETYPMESGIPWAGMWGTNHQYIGAEAGTAGTWKATGSGPHTPESADYNAGANGTYMWLKNGSWLYAKWDYGWAIDHTWSAIRLTQVTPEPVSAMLLLLGLPLLRRKAR